MSDWLEIQFWKVAVWLLNRGYGYCHERDGAQFGAEARCGSCNASDVQDWILAHVELIKK